MAFQIIIQSKWRLTRFRLFRFLAAITTPLDRTLGKCENIIQATHIIPPQIRPRVNLKAFGVGKTASAGPQRHGEFDDYQPGDNQTWRFWDPSLREAGVYKWQP